MIIHWLISAVAIMIAAFLLPGVKVRFVSALLASIVIGLLNLVVKPFIALLALPITVLTFGLFTFVINAIIILIAGAIVPGFKVSGFWWAILFSIVVTIVNTILMVLIGF